MTLTARADTCADEGVGLSPDFSIQEPLMQSNPRRSASLSVLQTIRMQLKLAMIGHQEPVMRMFLNCVPTRCPHVTCRLLQT